VQGYIGNVLKFLLVVLVIALVVYACVTLLDRQVSGRPKLRGGGSSGRSGRAPQRPIGPDDDPDFLRDLNRRRPPKPKGPKGPKGDE
jgi:hypothetical protein